MREEPTPSRPRLSVHIVEDDEALRLDLSRFLVANGYECSSADDMTSIVEDILDVDPSLVLLDLGLPYMDGLQICRELRARSLVPIVVLTSRNTDIDELMSITLGADDFVAKPFSPQVLLARISAVLRRSAAPRPRTIEHGNVTIDFDASLVRGPLGSMDLTPHERKTLDVLLTTPGVVVSRDQLMTALWERGDFVDDNTLTVTVNRLRRKLDAVGGVDFIKTIRGHGYRT